MRKAALYVRKSKFTDKGESVQNQIEMCKQYAKDRNIVVENSDIYIDEGYSGGTTDRPQFKKMLRDAKLKKFDILICYRLDRISRSIADFSNTIELLQEYNISFVSIREHFDTSTPMGRAMMYIASVFAQLERETIAERIRDNMLKLARTGRWLGGKTPTGFKSEPIIYYDENMNKKRMYILSPVTQEINLVKKLFEKYLELGSLTRLESWCHQNNIKTKNNKLFDKTTLKVILTNPVYATADKLLYEYFTNEGMDIASDKKDFNGKHGIMAYNKNLEKKGKKNKLKDKSEWIIAVAKHKPVVSSWQWIKVQEKINKNKEKAPRADSSKISLLTPLLICGNCGSKLKVTYKVVNGEIKHHYYKCTLKERSKGSLCNIKNLNGKIAEQNIIDEIKKIASSDSIFFKELTDRKNNFKGITENYQKRINDLTRQMKSYEDSINNLTLQLSLNENSSAAKYIINQIESLDAKIKKIKDEIENISKQQKNSLIEQKNIEIVQELLDNFATNFDSLEFDEKKKLLRDIIDSIIWDGDRLELNIFGYKSQ